MTFDSVDWAALEKRSEELSNQLVSPSLDNITRIAAQKEHSYVSGILQKHREIALLEEERAALERQKKDNLDPEFALLLDEELADITRRHDGMSVELEKLLFPPDERDNASVFLEIRAGTGGQEAALFASDLLRMYMMYAQKRGWRFSIVSESYTDLGGFREVVVHIEGKGVFGHLKFESGVHRVQRVPTTETSGRIHTSTATVAVLPEVEELDSMESIEINPTDLRIDVYRAGGAGGQHVNKTDSAVRITYLPTGLVVACQEDRSQHKNKAKAMKMLKMRLLEDQRQKQEAEMSQKRREQVGGGTRAEKARTYNFPQNRVSDHNANVTLNKLDMVMEGDLDDIIEPLMRQDAEERRKHIAYPFAKTS